MEVVFGLLLVLLGECCGTETVCDARQNGALCYGVLGRSVYLQLINNASGVDFKLIQNPNGSATEVVKMRKNDLRLLKTFQNRTDFFKDNGTLLIKTVEKTDAAVYKYDASENGIFVEVVFFNFTIEAPVSSLNYSCKCSAHGEMTVNCSSNGDSLHYSWTLEANNLTEETNIITLKKGQSGRLSCSVKNHVSSDTVTKDISTCPGIVFVKCLSNGRMIEEWVNKDNNTLCDEPPTVPHTTVTETSQTTTLGKGTTPPLTGHVTSSISSNHTLALDSSGGTQIPLPWYFPIAVSLAGVLLLLGVMVAVYYSQKRKVKLAAKPSDADDQDVTYADVSVLMGQMRQKGKPAAMEVEYGEVKVGPRGVHHDTAVYAAVRKGQ